MNLNCHKECSNLKTWKVKHHEEYDALLLKCKEPRSVFVPRLLTIISVNGKDYTITGGIKSLSPECLGKAFPVGEHPFTCTNCDLQLRDLKDLIRKRAKSKLKDTPVRLGVQGFRKDYSNRIEQKQEHSRRDEELQSLIREKASVRSMDSKELRLFQFCQDGDRAQLITELLQLFQNDTDKKHPVKFGLLQNLVGKLLRGRNHSMAELVVQISAMHHRRLGSTNYSTMADLFGLASASTIRRREEKTQLELGFNDKILENAIAKYRGLPVCECHDEARALRYLEPRIVEDGKLELIGIAWNPDIDTWSQQRFPLPEKAKGDPDQYTALKRFIENAIQSETLASSVSIHNLSGIAGDAAGQSLVHCIWPPRAKGFNSQHILKYWITLLRKCKYTESNMLRKVPLNILGVSTDSAGHSLSAAIKLMTPTQAEIDYGVNYLQLGVPGESFAAPYYWNLPTIAFLDHAHEQRLFLRNLKYETRCLTFFQEKTDVALASIQPLMDLKRQCALRDIECNLHDSDLILLKFMDQNQDACERIFQLKIADLLDKHVVGSGPTSLFIRAVTALMEPFRSPNFGTPGDVQESVSAGKAVLDHWRKYLELKGLLLNSGPGAANNPDRRGRYLTYGCHMTARIQWAAATYYNLALFLHFKAMGPMWSSPFYASTVATEHIIGQIQGKTTEFQCLDAQPTVSAILNRCTAAEANHETSRLLRGQGIKVGVSHRRKTVLDKRRYNAEQQDYKYPDTYTEFLTQQREAHDRGIKLALSWMEKYLPNGFMALLKENNSWGIPYKVESLVGQQQFDPDQCSAGYEKFNTPKMNNEPQRESVTDDTIEYKENSCPQDYHDQTDSNDDEDSLDFFKEDEQNKEEGTSKWYITRQVGKSTTNIHVKRAIKLLIPREYISRERRKRHWVHKHLPGLEPIKPEHDIVRFHDYALKHRSGFKVARLVSVESQKEGKQLISASKVENNVKLRFIGYEFLGRTYKLPISPLVSSLRSPLCVICHVKFGMEGEEFTLTQETMEALTAAGYNAMDPEKTKNNSNNISSTEKPSSVNSSIWYKVQDIVDVRVDPKTMSFDYKTRFSGYSEIDDQWLPSNAFNKRISFHTKSTRGRIRKHSVDPDFVTGAEIASATKKKQTTKKTSEYSKRTRTPLPISGERTQKKLIIKQVPDDKTYPGKLL